MVSFRDVQIICSQWNRHQQPIAFIILSTWNAVSECRRSNEILEYTWVAWIPLASTPQNPHLIALPPQFFECFVHGQRVQSWHLIHIPDLGRAARALRTRSWASLFTSGHGWHAKRSPSCPSKTSSGRSTLHRQHPAHHGRGLVGIGSMIFSGSIDRDLGPTPFFGWLCGAIGMGTRLYAAVSLQGFKIISGQVRDAAGQWQST